MAGLKAFKGHTSGYNSNGVLCRSSFMRIIYKMLRHTGKPTIRPPGANINLFGMQANEPRLSFRHGEGRYVISRSGLTLLAVASCNHKRTCSMFPITHLDNGK